MWAFVERTRKNSRKQNRHSISFVPCDDDINGCFCLHFRVRPKKSCFGENNKILRTGTKRARRRWIFANIQAVAERSSPKSSFLRLEVLLFRFHWQQTSENVFCLNHQEEDKISGVFNLRMKRLRVCFAPNRRLMTIDDVLFTSPLSCDLIETSSKESRPVLLLCRSRGFSMKPNKSVFFSLNDIYNDDDTDDCCIHKV